MTFHCSEAQALPWSCSVTVHRMTSGRGSDADIQVLTEQQMALQKLNTVLEDSKFDAKVIGDTLTRLGLP